MSTNYSEAAGGDIPEIGTSYREIVKSLTQGVLVFNSLSEVIYANQSAAEILGLEHEKMAGNKISDLISLINEDGSPVDPEDFPNVVTLRTGMPINMKTLGVYRPGANRRWIMLHDKTLTLNDGSIGVSSSFIDITDYRRSNLAANLFMELNSSVVHTRDEAELLQNMCDIVVKIGGYSLAAIGFPQFDPDRSIRFAYASGATEYLNNAMISWSGTSPSGMGPAGIAIRTGEVQIANDISSHPGYEPWRERARSFGFGSSISLLFSIGSETALLSVYAQDRFAFDEATVKMLKEIASEFGLGLEHVRSVERLGRSLNGTLAALSRLSESRDPYTSGHEARVGSLGGAIGKTLGLDLESIDLITKSGLVHDIGKIVVPIEILSRPGKLSPLEFELIKNHTSVGADILSQASLPWPISEVAVQHHERIDGSGYPNGLKGEEITLPARIIAVADVVEAMSEHRPYRPARGLDQSLEYVRNESGKLFDTQVVDACMAVFDSGFNFESGIWSSSTAENVVNT